MGIVDTTDEFDVRTYDPIEIFWGGGASEYSGFSGRRLQLDSADTLQKVTVFVLGSVAVIESISSVTGFVSSASYTASSTAGLKWPQACLRGAPHLPPWTD